MNLTEDGVIVAENCRRNIRKYVYVSNVLLIVL